MITDCFFAQCCTFLGVPYCVVIKKHRKQQNLKLLKRYFGKTFFTVHGLKKSFFLTENCEKNFSKQKSVRKNIGCVTVGCKCCCQPLQIEVQKMDSSIFVGEIMTHLENQKWKSLLLRDVYIPQLELSFSSTKVSSMTNCSTFIPEARVLIPAGANLFINWRQTQGCMSSILCNHD